MKMMTNYPMTERIRSYEPFRTPQNFWLQCLIFCAVFITGSIVQSCIMMVGFIPYVMSWMTEKMETTGEIDSVEAMEYFMNFLEDPSMTFIMLLSTVGTTITVLLFCRLIEGRKLHTIGFTKKGAVPQYLLGLAVGFVMFSAVVGLAWAFGGLHAEGFVGGSAVSILLALLGFGLQGMSEEVLCRGYLMTTILKHHKPWVAVMTNAVIFALLHGMNNGISLLAIINLTLCGIMFSLYMLRTDNLWGACAIHSIWNFVQGNFFGLPVSGIDSGDSVFRFSLIEGSDLANGGAFGLEGGLPCTIVLTAVILVLLFVPFGTCAAKQEKTA
ncbi:MAG: CPBP family intramembrane metalloprotease [Oscillospiraceae bacterium]|nr:CPBP family intramembrane metalloprotease [Oscillospiraceae bacterium]